jgi:hypothetical protein
MKNYVFFIKFILWVMLIMGQGNMIFSRNMPICFNSCRQFIYNRTTSNIFRSSQVYITNNGYNPELKEYDQRMSRRWDPDPMTQKYPGLSPYSVFNNNPIYFADPKGLEGDPPSKGQLKKLENLRNRLSKGKNLGLSDRAFFLKWNNWDYNPNNEGYKKNGAMGYVLMPAGYATGQLASVEVFQGAASKVLETTVKKEITRKGLEQMGGRLFMQISPYAGVVAMTVGLYSANPDSREKARLEQLKMDRATFNINEAIASGEYEAAYDLYESWNKKFKYNRIVFRYMVTGEYENTQSGGFSLNLDQKNQWCKKYITPDLYWGGKIAQTLLDLPNRPQCAIFCFEKDIIRTKIPAGAGVYGTVPGYEYGFPGGGKEATINQPFPIRGFFPLYYFIYNFNQNVAKCVVYIKVYPRNNILD